MELSWNDLEENWIEVSSSLGEIKLEIQVCQGSEQQQLSQI